jgi:hypothetical protein
MMDCSTHDIIYLFETISKSLLDIEYFLLMVTQLVTYLDSFILTVIRSLDLFRIISILLFNKGSSRGMGRGFDKT